jgi:SNF2 family DNA or RNA helicase
VIIWARFRPELDAIAHRMKKEGLSFVEYRGGVSDVDRERAINDFQSGAARFFLGNAQAGSTGLTLTRAETVVYYSNDFTLANRIQSEDRAHRIGQRQPVTYIDLVATGTLDEKIASALQRKADVAAEVLGDLQ